MDGGSEIHITGEPSRTGDRCVFTVDRPVFPAESAHFTAANASLSPLASEILAIPGVESTLIADNTVTVNAAHEVDWPALQVGQIIRRHLKSGVPIVTKEYFAGLPSEGDLKWAIQDLLDREINPAVAGHGGWIELIDVKRNAVFLRLGGGCQGCGAADVTLKQGIERLIKEEIPEVEEVLDTTDHASGENPYYTPSK